MEKENIVFRFYVTAGHNAFNITCRDRFLSKQLWASRLHNADIHIQTKHKLLSAHNMILALNSIFREEMTSAVDKESIICLSDCDSADVECLFFYIYTGQLLTNASSIPLLHLASKYQLNNLASLCTQALNAKDARTYMERIFGIRR
jgi:hypothetical protein